MYISNKIAAHMRDIILLDVVSSGLIDTSAPWTGNRSAPPLRYKAEIDGIPAIIEVSTWDEGICWVRWVLWPASADVALARSPGDKWPGDAWGLACIDRRIGLRLGYFCWVKCRNSKRQRLGEIPHPHHVRLQEYFDPA